MTNREEVVMILEREEAKAFLKYALRESTDEEKEELKKSSGVL